MKGRLVAVGLVAAATVLCMAPVAAQTTRALVVVGLGGTSEYRERFTNWAVELQAALTRTGGIPVEDVVVLAERSDAAPGVVKDRSTRENVVAALGDLARRSGSADRLLVVLIGHGTAQGDEGQFNLPGPDISGEELAAALAAFPTQTVAVVHTGSAGGSFVAPLSGPNRITLSATRTSRERNATEFAGYFVEALTGDAADLDKDGQVSLLEAFTYTRAEVARHYAEENELLTEHALLDDNGDGEGSPDPGPEGGDGRLANAFRLGGGAETAVRTTDDAVLNQLLREREEIQARIDALRTRRGSMSQEAYDTALEEILVELALKTREIRAREGGGS
ncbi:MAG TPA: hypothetical protein VLA36_12685 [Longimicrobiales bacterium]|nr:hypothetical protein [Longimicrobiales bacterium]